MVALTLADINFRDVAIKHVQLPWDKLASSIAAKTKGPYSLVVRSTGF